MKRRLETPDKSNKYYLKKPYGYSPCVLGNSNHRYAPYSVLVNCVGAATGRFNEIIGEAGCPYLGNTNAENFITLAKSQGLEIGQEPREGGCMVWAKGKIGDGSDGAGHVASVEKVLGNDQVKTFESGWNYTKAYTLMYVRTKGSGDWGLTGYTYLGCIYNPRIDPYAASTGDLRYGSRGESVKWLQWALVQQGLDISIDGAFGRKTEEALKTFQSRQGLLSDGICGPGSRARIKELYTLED